MVIGRLDRKISLQSYTMTKNVMGEAVKTWTEVASIWGTMTYPKGLVSDEKLEQGRETAVVPVEWWIRYREGVNEAMRILYKSEYYYITRVNYPDRNKSLKLVCEKRV